MFSKDGLLSVVCATNHYDSRTVRTGSQQLLSNKELTADILQLPHLQD